jgi:hypothetical protein
MREIKFRAYCDIGEENKMLYFTEGKYDNGLWFEHTSNHIDKYLSPLMQFTNVKDSENVDVYEDDIIQYSNGVKTVVKWGQDECFGRNYDGYCFRSDENTFKVIGNIHENPELL